jgi:uncharacterized membrane-anchored protein
MKIITIALALLLAFASHITTVHAQQSDPQEEQYNAWAKELWQSLNRRHGDIELPNGEVTLKVPADFYYLSPQDAEKVLVEVWGNPPGAGINSQGILFPASVTPFDDESWAVTIDYEQDGYVSDEDADSIDYTELLEQMQEGTAAASEERVAQGYGSIELIGWASTPYYDKASHKLHWAKEVRFDNQEPNTLNYNIRVLGRKGVLILNFVADMSQKSLIDSQLDTVMAMADFDTGSRYTDFDPSIDEVAAYGIGALVAGKVAAKVGLLAGGLLLLKKFGVLIVIGFGALMAKLFKRNKA